MTNNNSTTNNNTSRPTRFGTKRSRSRSPRVSRFDSNSHGNDFKRARTDNSRPSQPSPSHVSKSSINSYLILNFI